jgi:hypothetical protein
MRNAYLIASRYFLVQNGVGQERPAEKFGKTYFFLAGDLFEHGYELFWDVDGVTDFRASISSEMIDTMSFRQSTSNTVFADGKKEYLRHGAYHFISPIVEGKSFVMTSNLRVLPVDAVHQSSNHLYSANSPTLRFTLSP